MKKYMIIIGLSLVLVIAGYLLFNLRSVYFVDMNTQEKTKLTSFWVKQDHIDIKDRWFKDFDDDVISGFILIEDKKTYTIIPYAFTKLDESSRLIDLYESTLERSKEIKWIAKEYEQDVLYDIKEEVRLDISVDTYLGSVTEENKYGNGIYSVPTYNDSGEIVSYVQFAESSVSGLLEGFNQNNPCYILQAVLFVEVHINNHQASKLLIPTYFIGGLVTADITSDHYYIEYFDQLLVFEATLEKLEVS